MYSTLVGGVWSRFHAIAPSDTFVVVMPIERGVNRQCLLRHRANNRKSSRHAGDWE